MRKLLVVLSVAAAAAAFMVLAGTAFADRGGGTQDPPPEDAPCGADHGHPPCPPDGGNGNGDGDNGNGGNGPAVKDCMAPGHETEDTDYGPLTGGLHDNLTDELPEPLAATGHHALCAVAALTGGGL